MSAEPQVDNPPQGSTPNTNTDAFVFGAVPDSPPSGETPSEKAPTPQDKSGQQELRTPVGEDQKPSDMAGTEDEDLDLDEAPATPGTQAPGSPSIDPEKKYSVGGQELTGKEISDGLLRQVDYTQKTMALSDQRKTLDRAIGEIADLKDKYSEATEAWETFLEQLSGGDPVDWDKLAQEDPEEYVRQSHERQKRLGVFNEARSKLKSDRERIGKEKQQGQQREFKEWIGKQGELIKTMVPELADPKTAETHEGRITKFLTEKAHFGNEDIAGLMDARMIWLADQAMRYHEAKARAEEKRKKLPAPKTIGSGGRDGTGQRRDERTSDGRPMLDFPSMRDTT